MLTTVGPKDCVKLRLLEAIASRVEAIASSSKDATRLEAIAIRHKEQDKEY